MTLKTWQVRISAGVIERQTETETERQKDRKTEREREREREREIKKVRAIIIA